MRITSLSHKRRVLIFYTKTAKMCQDIDKVVGRCEMTMTEKDGFTVYGRQQLSLPVLLSVPHAGRDYPEIVFQSLRLPRESLIRLEDRYADLLLRASVGSGIPAIVAHKARAWIDLNRDERDLDVEMVRSANAADYPAPGLKQRGGLGLVPRRLAGDGDIWKCQFEMADINTRIESYHRPYHAEIDELLKLMHAKFGVAILLDLHSMPPIRQSQSVTPPQFVVGDRFGQSCSSPFSELLVEQIRLSGYRAALNHPYSGEHILRRHARPRSNVHALQLEVDRSLYLDSNLREPTHLLGSISLLVANLARALASQALGSSTLIAAE